MQLKENSNASAYYNLLSNLNESSKLELIAHLSNSILKNKSSKPKSIERLFGAWKSKETAEETCARELFEEMKIKIDISKLKYLASLPNIYEYKNIIYNTLDLFYEYESEKKFEVNLEISEISETVWLKIKDINPAEIAFDSQRFFLEKYKIQ